MTWSLSAAGHNDNNSEDAEKVILKDILNALHTEGNTVSSFSFGGNYVRVGSLQEAEEKVGE